jgi:hypothetical protein
LGATGSVPATGGWCATARSHILADFLDTRAQGKPGADCARRPACESSERKHTGFKTTGTARTSRLSPRNGFTAYTRSPRGSGLSCPRCRRNICFRQRSARVAAPGPHDFAVRCKRFVRHANMPDVCASIASQAQRIVTIATRPSGGFRVRVI